EGIIIQRPTTTTVSTATINYTSSGNTTAPVLSGSPTSVADAVPASQMLANIGDFVWFDADEDGIQDGGEEGIEGITLNLSGSGLDIDVQTDADGNYLFPSLFPGTYTLTVTPTTDYPSISASDQGGDDAVDSDFDAVGNSTVILVGGSGSDISVDVALNTTPLPVELLEFEANGQAESVSLMWMTASELNNQGFSIERKTTEGSFAEIAFVAGQGTSSALHTYSFVDENVQMGQVYWYRLKQYDLDGRFSFSDIVSVSMETESVIRCFPNPVVDELNIRAEHRIRSISLYDLTGRVVLRQEVNTINPTIKLAEIPKGRYWVKIIDERGQSHRQALTK
ncbi:MAG: SdrD B-like domain-containing protein, partial [Bacteroidota bacterium]